MYKIVFALNRKPGMSQQEFRDFWLTDHAPKVVELPGVRRYHVDVCIDDGDGTRPADGFAVLWFDDEDAFRAAFSSDYALRDVIPNNDNFNDASRRYAFPVTEHVFR